MHLVREMKEFGDVRVANAMFSLGWEWRNPRRRPTNIDRMVQGLPRCELVKILNVLRKRAKLNRVQHYCPADVSAPRPEWEEGKS